MDDKKPQFREHWFFYASIYSVSWLAVPVSIYLSDTLFKRFCSFHKRVLKLQGRSTNSLIGLAIVTSLFYSTITLNIYYYGLLKIVGLNSVSDLEGIITNQFIEDDN